MTEEVAKTPVRFALIEKSLSAEFRADFPNYPEGLVRGDPGGFVLTQKYADNVDSILQFPMRSEDVWVVTFPKCGKLAVLLHSYSVNIKVYLPISNEFNRNIHLG